MWKYGVWMLLLVMAGKAALAGVPVRAIDVQHYTLHLEPDADAHTLRGRVDIRFRLEKGRGSIAFQLDTLLRVDSVAGSAFLAEGFTRKGRNIYVETRDTVSAGVQGRVSIWYQGRPHLAPNPPWDGGLVWARSADNKPWIGVACQEVGASVWWPCKEDLADEPDSGVSIYCQAPLGLAAVCNGRLIGSPQPRYNGKAAVWHWEVSYPINPYCVTFNIGNYACVRDSLPTPGGRLASSVWLLKEDSARGYAYLLPRVRQMMEQYQALFGAYPFRRDGYQLVQAAYWGMEHQSAVAYGNQFKPDEFGLDFILIHESGHEWWGNLVSVADNADLWVHEAFCTYGEALLCERLFGKKAMARYLDIQRSHIKNLSPLQGPKHQNYHGWLDSDIYYRGAGLLHTVRLMTGDSAKFIHALQAVLRYNSFKPASTESVLQVLSAELGFEKATFLRYALALPCIPFIEVWKQGNNAYEYRLPGYKGPSISLHKGVLLDGTWRKASKRPDIPLGWMLTERRVSGKPRD